MTNNTVIKIQLLEEIFNKIQAEIKSTNIDMAKAMDITKAWNAERVIALQDAQSMMLKLLSLRKSLNFRRSTSII